LNVHNVLRHSGATYRQLDYWWTRGYFAEDGRPPWKYEGGSGIYRDWTIRECAIAALIVRLGKFGMKPAPAALIARRVVDDGLTEYAAHGIRLTLSESCCNVDP
jgi:hypothetical protein